ncbi:MAG TPA: protein BatD [bacterium (Candidatus Stahlbacteria)]|nr:protein BatD [Candidatus Stahlbacteria bacterium]
MTFSAAIRFYGEVDQNEIRFGESLILSLTVEGDVSRVPNPELGAIDDFRIESRSKSRSTSVSIINGRMEKKSTITFVYRIRPKRAGKLTIPSARIRIGDSTYITKPIPITVVKDRPRPKAKGEPIYLKLNINKRKVYAGEPVIISYYLYTRFDVANLSLITEPGFSGFWTEEYTPKQLKFKSKVIDGIRYNYALIRRYYLFPIQARSYEVTPLVLSCDVLLPSRSFFDFFSETRRVELSSDPVTVIASPLPEPRPDGFTGGVGRFRFEVSLDRTESRKSEPIILTCKITGCGNVKVIDAPRLPEIDGVQILKPEIKDRIERSKDRISGTRTFSFPIIPKRDGKIIIPPISFSYFLPGKGYQTVRSERLEFISRECKPLSYDDKTGIEILGGDIHYIKPDLLRIKSFHLYPPFIFNLLYPISIGIIILALLYRFHQHRLITDQAYMRRREAKGRFMAALNMAKKEGSIGFIYKGLLDYIGDRLNLPTRRMSKSELEKALLRQKIESDTVKATIALLSELEEMSYGGGELKTVDELLKKTKAVVKRL